VPSAPPAILLANHLSTQLLQEALGMRVFSVLGKPVDFNQLLDALARVLRRYHENRWPIFMAKDSFRNDLLTSL